MNRVGTNSLELRLNVVTSSEKIGILKTAKLYNISRDTVYRWIDNYKNKGIEGLYNKSRKDQNHPYKTSLETKKKILNIAKKYPDLSLKQIKSSLSLDISEVTISKILKSGNYNQTHSDNKPLSLLKISVEKILRNSKNNLPSYLIVVRDNFSNMIWCGLTDINSNLSVGIFLDYILSLFNTSGGIIVVGKGSFFSRNKVSYFQKIAQKYSYKIIKGKKSENLDNSFISTILESKNLKRDEFIYNLFNVQTELNLKYAKSKDSLKSIVLVSPIYTDKHFSSTLNILKEHNYWKEIASGNKSRFESIFKMLMKKRENKFDAISIISINELYELFNLSGLRDSHLKTEMQFMLAKSLELYGLDSNAIKILEHIVEISFKLGKLNDAVDGIYRLGEFYFKKGMFSKALSYYMDILKKVGKQTYSFISNDIIIKLSQKSAECCSLLGDFKRAIYYYNKALKLACNKEDKCLISIEKAMLYNTKGNFSHSIFLLKKLINESPNKDISAKIYGSIAMNYYYMWNEKEAEKYQILQLENIDKNKDKETYARTKARVGIIKYGINPDSSAESYFDEQIEFYEDVLKNEKSSKLDKIFALQRIAAVRSTLNEYELSIEFHKKAVLMCKEIGNYDRLSVSYNLISNDYLSLNNIKMALKYRKKELSYLNKLNDFQKTYRAKRQIAYCYMLLSNFSKAISIYNEIIDESIELKNRSYYMEACGNLGAIYTQTKEFDKAYEYLNKYKKLAISLGLKRFVGNAYLMFAQFYELKDGSAFNYSKLDNLYKLAVKNCKYSGVFKDIVMFMVARYKFLIRFDKLAKAEKFKKESFKYLTDKGLEKWCEEFDK